MNQPEKSRDEKASPRERVPGEEGVTPEEERRGEPARERKASAARDADAPTGGTPEDLNVGPSA
ncbi:MULTISPECIES: hypothetical protein [Streptomyces]|uniref:Uncharacterized protein n=2 Tax=Streptomyces TaxID=1883 RepID=A0A100Y9M4_9ACTN|nr:MULTISPECIES: hypothetical protein [Streptomyces]KUH40204.1 hypothetical protein ATE80_02555 [Streptomyces kanasensis]UUS34188.1 hypothetical protein NRO40_27410 [Streptomyces changanensis]